MENNLLYFETNSTDPHYNLAFEEYILEEFTKGDVLILWQNDKSVIIGQNQNTLSEINEDFVKKNNISVVRRCTGGGAVFHDLGNINYSFISDYDKKNSFQRFSIPVVDALKALDLNATTSGRNDILVENMKVSGTAQRIVKNRILHHGTLLFDTDEKMIGSALNPNNNKFRTKASASVKSRTTNIKSHLKSDMDLRDFFCYIKNSFLSGEKIAPYKLSDHDLSKIQNLKSIKYDTWEWNYKKSPLYETSNKKAFPGGVVEAVFTVDKGIIIEIEFWGDFMSRKPLTVVTDALIGCEYKKEPICKVLSSIDSFFDYFGNISPKEIASTIINIT